MVHKQRGLKVLLTCMTGAVALTLGGVPAGASSLSASPGLGSLGDVGSDREDDAAPGELRVASFNVAMNRDAEGELVDDLATGADSQAQAVAEIIQHVRPDVLLLNEFDYVEGGQAVDLFRDLYLESGQGDAKPIEYEHSFVAPSNTGVQSGHDLNNDGETGGPDDTFGFGEYEGQYGMAVLSRYPIEEQEVRTFQHFRWADMPGALLPSDPDTPETGDWYSPEALEVFRLSSKSHWDVPIRVDDERVHLLASHPTPPAFDGEEGRNLRRNHDEIRFWADYVTPGDASEYIYDDAGARGGLDPDASFVIAGDLNADPHDGDSFDGAIDQLLGHPRVTDPTPRSLGGVEAAQVQGGANDDHVGDPALDTADFTDDAPGNLRVDYVLPSQYVLTRDSGVFWPVSADPLSRLTGVYPFPSSDHRLVWADVTLGAGEPSS